MSSLLLVDDEPEILETTRFAFEMAGFDVLAAASGEEALEAFKTHHPQVLLIDYKLTGMSGTELLKAVKAIDPKVPAILFTGLTHESEAIEAESRRLGAYAFLRKPLRMEDVLHTVHQALHSSSPT